jgi:hypothetical protein
MSVKKFAFLSLEDCQDNCLELTEGLASMGSDKGLVSLLCIGGSENELKITCLSLKKSN